MGPNLGVELEPADPQVHPGEALVCSDGVDLGELALPYGGGAHGSVGLVVEQVEGLLEEQGAAAAETLLDSRRKDGLFPPSLLPSLTLQVPSTPGMLLQSLSVNLTSM